MRTDLFGLRKFCSGHDGQLPVVTILQVLLFTILAVTIASILIPAMKQCIRGIQAEFAGSGS